MVIKDLAKRNNWSYEETMDRFYNSEVCRYLSDRNNGLFTFPPVAIIDLFSEGIPGAVEKGWFI
jgi:hypothetical protein